MSGNGFDQMASAGSLLGIGMQIPDVTLDLRSTLDNHRGDVTRAAANRGMRRTWAAAAPETRSALLLNLAWHGRGQDVPEDDGTPARGYAADLHRYASGFEGDSEAFHGRGFPAMPLPGHAGILASSLGFDRDDTDISLGTVLILLSAIPAAPADSSDG
jgi:hypothetical protein